MPSFRRLTLMTLAGLSAGSTALAQDGARPDAPGRRALERRLAPLLDEPPYDRATWGVYAVDERGRVLYARNADRLFIPASSTKLVVSATAAALLPPDYRVRTSLYINGSFADGVLDGDLVLYGRGDPSFSTRCYATDTLLAGVCDSAMTVMGALADLVVAQGVRRITGRVLGDGSYFEPRTLHPRWELFDAAWWYAAPISGLAFNDNSIDFRITPGVSVDAPPTITWSPDVGLVAFENRARTGPADSASTIGDHFYRVPGTWQVWAEGTAARGRRPWTQYFAVPDPNLYAARALAVALLARGVSIEGGALGTTDSLLTAAARAGPPLVERLGRPLPDLIFPILNTSQNTFAEYVLKVLGRELGGVGSWDAGIEVERRFLIDSVRIDSTAFYLDDGSGLSAGNLVTPGAFVQLLDYMARHPRRAAFLAAIPRSGAPGSLLNRFTGSALAGRVVAKTGSITHVNTLSGYIDRGDGRHITFSIQANGHTVSYNRMLARIDAIVEEIGRTR
jgi:D-alanyl-D-alanine carboxypeptidase/D-alanyl-D-alanine-endopeptidase (penicillin-binding protein 4)